MLTRALRSLQRQTGATRKQRVWPWAVGSIALPLFVIASTLLGARYVARARLAAMVAPAPALAPLRVQTAIQPAGGAALWGLAYITIERAGGAQSEPRIIAYTYSGPSICIPDTACAPPRTPSQLTFYDGVSGQSAFSREITPRDMSQCSTLLNGPTGKLYIVCPGLVEVISPASGQTLNLYTLPEALDTAHAALDTATNTLFLTGAGALHSFDLKTGAPVASRPLSGAVSAPIVDAGLGRVFVLENSGGAQPILAAFRTRTLLPLGAEALTPGWRAGPREDDADKLFLYGPDGAVGTINLGLPTLGTSAPYPTASLSMLSQLSGARALGWDGLHQTLVALYPDHVTAFDAESLQPFAESPVSGAWDEQRPLEVDNVDAVAYVPDASGAIVALSLNHPESVAALDTTTAVALARAGLATMLPDTNQAPPFLARQTFPVIPSTLPREFAIHYSDLGWRGPYPGSASAKVVAQGKQSGDYTISFTVSWNQLFVHVHTWEVELLPDGRVKMLSDTGDAIP
jgi:hypothetical protein